MNGRAAVRLGMALCFSALLVLLWALWPEPEPGPRKTGPDEAPATGSGAAEAEISSGSGSTAGSAERKRDQNPPRSIDFVAEATVPIDPHSDSHAHHLKEWKGAFSPPIWHFAQVSEQPDPGRLSLTLPDSPELEIQLNSFRMINENSGVLSGRVAGAPMGEVVLSFVNQSMAGSIHLPESDSVYEIRNAGGGQQYVALVDVEALGRCGLCGPEEAENGGESGE